MSTFFIPVKQKAISKHKNINNITGFIISPIFLVI